MSQLNRREFLGLAAGAAGASLVPAAASSAGAAENAAAHAPPPAGQLAFTRQVPVGPAFDVVVCGAGPAGLGAALAAARAGLKVLLVDSQGQLGGTGTSGLVSHWLGGRIDSGAKWAVGGIFRSLSEEAAKRGIALIPTPDRAKVKYQPHGWLAGQLGVGIPFDPFAMAAMLDEKAAEAGIEVLLATQAVDVAVAGGRITHVILFNKGGLRAVPARTVVDATGDADIAARSGCETIKGRDTDHLMTPATLMFHAEGVDQDALAAYITANDSPRFRPEILKWREAGLWKMPYEIFISVQLTEKGTMMINTSRLTDVDGTDGASISRAYARGRAENRDLLDIARKNIAGFAAARVKAVAPMLGVRETRRIRGPGMLTVKDLIEGQTFDDTVGYTAYTWDLPDPKAPSLQPMHGTATKRSVTPIPYRVMLPQPVRNLICPGRAVNVERDVLGPLRVTAPCFAMGEAAGLAAAQVIGGKASFADVDTKALRESLVKAGAVVDWE